MEVLADKETMQNLNAALDDERHGRLFKRDKNGKWLSNRGQTRAN
jgi:hypothetical protein